MTNSADRRPPLQVVVLTGMAGSGKSVALHALEDIGYYCVDNLPPELLPSLVSLEHWQHGNRVAIAIDARSAKALYLVPEQLEKLRATGAQVQLVLGRDPLGLQERQGLGPSRRREVRGPIVDDVDEALLAAFRHGLPDQRPGTVFIVEVRQDVERRHP